MCTMRAYVPKACQHFIFTCQRHAIFQIGVPMCQKHANISFLRAKDVPFFKLACQTYQKACQFFNYFSKEKVFQLWLAFANFKNTWKIIENLSREAKNLKQNIFTFACFSHAHHKSFWRNMHYVKWLWNYFRNKSTWKHSHKKWKETRSQ